MLTFHKTVRGYESGALG